MSDVSYYLLHVAVFLGTFCITAIITKSLIDYKKGRFRKRKRLRRSRSKYEIKTKKKSTKDTNMESI